MLSSLEIQCVLDSDRFDIDSDRFLFDSDTSVFDSDTSVFDKETSFRCYALIARYLIIYSILRLQNTSNVRIFDICSFFISKLDAGGVPMNKMYHYRGHNFLKSIFSATAE